MAKNTRAHKILNMLPKQDHQEICEQEPNLLLHQSSSSAPSSSLIPHLRCPPLSPRPKTSLPPFPCPTRTPLSALLPCPKLAHPLTAPPCPMSSPLPPLPASPLMCDEAAESPLTNDQLEFCTQVEKDKDLSSCIEEISKIVSPSSSNDHDPYSTDGDCSWSPGDHNTSLSDTSTSSAPSIDPILSDTAHCTSMVPLCSKRSHRVSEEEVDYSKVLATDTLPPVTAAIASGRSSPGVIEHPSMVSMNATDILAPQRMSKKRVRKQQTWKREVAKKKRLVGDEYNSAVCDKVIKKKELKPPCPNTCRMKCNTKITEADRQLQFNTFWEIPSWDQRRQFIASTVDVDTVNRARKRNDGSSSRRSKTRRFFLIINGEKMHVCQKMFLNTFSLSEQYISTTLKKKTSNTGMVQSDQRRKRTPSNRTPDDVIVGIKEHISHFPSYVSHYSRERTSRKYLGPELNLSKLYALYVQKCKDNNVLNEKIGREWLYRKIFNKDFNLTFHCPSNDTCDTCDRAAVRLKHATDNVERELIEAEKKAHHDDASMRYGMKNNDKAEAKQSDGQKKTVMIDMQKCLPTPSLTNCQSFYLRKLWELNETIYDSTSNSAYCMMWNETLGARGANEVASCLVEWALNYLTPITEEITIWSDNCAGQNRNIFLVYAYFWLIQYTNIKVINHKFLLRGHTHLQVDTIHSIIERKKKQLPSFQIEIPRDWEQFVRTCKTNNPLVVHSMNLQNFRDYKSLGTQFTNRRTNSDGENFSISQCVWLRIDKNSKGILMYKTTFKQDEFFTIDLRRNTRQELNLPRIIPPVNLRPRPISTAKYNDLIKLTEWVSESMKAYYVNLRHGANGLDDV